MQIRHETRGLSRAFLGGVRNFTRSNSRYTGRGCAGDPKVDYYNIIIAFQRARAWKTDADDRKNSINKRACSDNIMNARRACVNHSAAASGVHVTICCVHVAEGLYKYIYIYVMVTLGQRKITVEGVSNMGRLIRESYFRANPSVNPVVSFEIRRSRITVVFARQNRAPLPAQNKRRNTCEIFTPVLTIFINSITRRIRCVPSFDIADLFM